MSVILAKPAGGGGTGGGGSSINIAQEVLLGTQAGADVTFDLTGLSNPYTEIIAVKRIGQDLTPDNTDGFTVEWTQVGNTVTVPSAYDTDVFQFQYTYNGGGGATGQLTVADQDGTPTVTNVTKINFPNGSVTDNLDGSVDVDLGGSGTVTTVSVASANGFSGTVANATTTPAITIKTTVTGLIKGNGTALSAAVEGTDYYAPGGTDVAVADGGTGASTAAGARTNLGLGTLATQSGTFSGTSSGTNTGDQTITLTGDVTGSGTGSFAATLKNALKDFAHGFTTSGTVVTGKVKGFYTHPQAATLVGWNITVDAGTMTVKTWKIASGTAKPTISNVISTSGVAISTGTAVQSTTMSDFTSTAVSAGDIFAWDITAVSGVGEATFELIFRNS